MNAFSPTTQQKLAIDYPKSMVITACPGSGKTTVIKEILPAVSLSIKESLLLHSQGKQVQNWSVDVRLKGIIQKIVFLVPLIVFA